MGWYWHQKINERVVRKLPKESSSQNKRIFNLKPTMVYRLRNSGVGISVEATLLFFMGHIFIGLAARASSTFSTIYALAIFLAGVMVTLTRRSILVACVVGYITGIEVLLRMTDAAIFWEFGKYAVVGILILGVITRRERKRWPIYLALYMLFLLPGVLMTPYESWTQWRKIISFNMSGPLSLCLCGLYFSGLTFNKQDLRRIFTWIIGPVISIGTVTLVGIIQATTIGWGRHSLKVTAGGFGPNQVCSILGLGAFLALVYCVLTKGERVFKIIFMSISFWFFIHAVLTFSRGGVLGSSLPFLVFMLFVIKSRRNKFIALCTGLLFISLNYYYVIPKLNQVTKGALGMRYTQREQIKGREIYSTTERIGYFIADIDTFRGNLLFGMGVGNSVDARGAIVGRLEEKILAHTEWSRMLAEHGMLGVFSMIMLWLWILKKYRTAKDFLLKALSVYLILSIALYMGHSAMRLVLPSLMLGLLSADLKLTE